MQSIWLDRHARLRRARDDNRSVKYPRHPPACLSLFNNLTDPHV